MLYCFELLPLSGLFLTFPKRLGALLSTLCVLLLAFCLPPRSLSAQSPWPRSKAGFFVQASWNFIPTYEAIYTPSGAGQTLDRQLSENTFQGYAEYGIDRKTTLTAVLPVHFLRSGALVSASSRDRLDSGSLTGIGNISLAVRRSFSSGNLAFSGQLRVDLPAGKYHSNTGLRAGYDALTVLPVLSLGMGLRKAYWFAYGGYGARGIFANHFLTVGAEAGLHLNRFWCIGFSEWWYPTGSRVYVTPAENYLTGLYVPNQGYWSIGAKTLFELNRFWGLTASGAGAGWGQYVPKRPAFSLGAYFKWD